jgi:hypothetical protein
MEAFGAWSQGPTTDKQSCIETIDNCIEIREKISDGTRMSS